VTSFKCLRIVANGEIVGHANNYSGFMKIVEFPVEVMNKHMRPNLVQQYIVIYCQGLAVSMKKTADLSQIQA
jgi:hypothetical protein